MEEIHELFDYHAVSAEEKAHMARVREAFSRTYQEFEAIPSCRAKSLATTALEESCMWAMKAIKLRDRTNLQQGGR